VVFVVFYKFNPVKKPATGSVVIQSSVPGAVIYLNGEETDFFTPDTIKNVETGNYYISVFRDGYAVFPPMKSVPVSKNRISKADFELKNMSAMALARVHVNVSKYRLYVDGLPFPVDAEGYAKVPYGYHTFMVVKEGFLGYPSYRRLLLEKDDTTDVQFELVPDTEIGYLQISDNIFGGYVYLDKQFTGLQARGNLLPVKAGIYEVRVRENGYRCVPDSQLINLLPGEKRLLVFRMVPEEKSASLTVRSGEPGAAIYVTPVMDLKVSPGHHYINLARGGLQYSALDKPVNIGNTELPEYYFDF
jgi:hypothetical protein